MQNRLTRGLRLMTLLLKLRDLESLLKAVGPDRFCYLNARADEVLQPGNDIEVFLLKELRNFK